MSRPEPEERLDIGRVLPANEQRVHISTSSRRYGKIVTIVDGLGPKDVDVRALAKRLKTLVAAGGTSKDGRIELQGDHRERVRSALERMGFTVE